MKHYRVNLRLIDDVILSESSKTTGGHQSLDYIPGNVLLGLAASRLYAKQSQAENDILFHSGKVRFCNGYISIDGQTITQPVPLSWHQIKGETIINSETGLLNSSSIFNLSVTQIESHKQPKQIRSGFVDKYGHLIRPKMRQHMKTAIDGSTGRAEDSQLYQYQALSAGQTFIAHIQVDDDVDSSSLLQALTGAARLGRAKSAEFGRVEICIESTKPAALSEVKDELIILCESDLALLDRWGMPSTRICPSAFGLDDGQIDWNKSYTRSRSVSLYNGVRGSLDKELPLICKGSVIVIKLPHPISKESISALCSGKGLEQQAGFGQLTLLDKQAHPTFEKWLGASETVESPIAPDSSFSRWLQAKQNKLNHHIDTDRKIEALRDSGICEALYQTSRDYHGAVKNVAVGPSATQWGRVLGLAKQPGLSMQRLLKELFEGESAICKAADSDWDCVAFDSKHRQTTFRHWFQDSLLHYKCAGDAAVIKACQSIAIYMKSTHIQALRMGDSIQNKEVLRD
jgi:CRISPR-associated protein Csx10